MDVAGETKLSIDLRPECPTTSQSLRGQQRETRYRGINSLKWVVLGAFVLFMLDGWLFRVLISSYPDSNVRLRDGVTEEQAREMLVKDKMRTVIDGHNDLPYMIRLWYGNQIYGSNFDFMNLPYHVDGARLEKSNVLGTFWSIFVPCPKTDRDEHGVEFDDAIYAEGVKETFQQADLVRRLIDQNSVMLHRTTSAHDFTTRHQRATSCWFEGGASQNIIDACLFKEIFSPEHNSFTDGHDDECGKIETCVSLRDQGWLSSMMGAEGLHQIGNSVANLRALYELGVRYMTLTHECNNRYADSATAPDGPRWGGLSEEGREIVGEMNRIGMLVDLSHVSADVMREVLGEVSKAPVMFSHSSAWALCPHPRNVPDDVLQLVKKNKGVVMVNIYPKFIACGPGKDPKSATLEMVVDHIEYIGKLIGWEHVGIGTDFDGIDSVPIGLEDVAKFPNITIELLRRGVKAVNVVKVMGLNILRVWRGVEMVGTEMRNKGVLPMEDKLRRSMSEVKVGGVSQQRRKENSRDRCAREKV